ncbi:Arginine glutamic acid dipeptide RE repeat [Fasciolopsis buskii]|uniref:Arginine glutamic acid dipeptide RE repeat n=1 Tax=Fasciolopsis buskii TaxID=27845 RepID=A0A8E0VLG4_9TREM|nr:Arginine glutamic acid dipeptide RE repeat [Fasciolopsis buski]
MSECAVLSTNGEVRYHETSSNSAANGEVQTAFVSSVNPSTSLNMTESEVEKVESSLSVPAPVVLPTSINNSSSTEQQSKASDDYSSGLEVPLRRSKRGKGRGTSNVSGHNSNGVSSDDRVSSCVVEGVEYKTGDFVYYEEPDFEYYTIGLIEEIKFSRRDKFAVLVKCFYRTHDIPETSKQSVLERENFHTPSNSKLMNDVLSRELFASEVQETLTSKQLRGRCHVSHLGDLHTAMSTFCPTEEDSFFYVFAYNPETRRLMNTRAEIRVGTAYQASIPAFRHCPPATYRIRPHHCINCPKHNRPTQCNQLRNTDPLPSSSNFGAFHPETQENNPGLTSGQTPAPEDLVSAIPHNMNEEKHAMKAHSPYAPSNANRSDENCSVTTENEEAKSPPKLESFRSGSPKRSMTSSPSASNSASHLDDGCPRPSSHRPDVRRRIISSRHDSCSRLINPLRRRIKRTHSVHRRVAGHRRRKRRFETIVWRPQGLSRALSGHSPDPMITRVTQGDGELADEPLKTYLDAVRSIVAFFGFGGADDDLSSAENGLVLANLATTTQHAYDTLHKSDYSLTHALQAISCNPIVAKVSWFHIYLVVFILHVRWRRQFVVVRLVITPNLLRSYVALYHFQLQFHGCRKHLWLRLDIQQKWKDFILRTILRSIPLCGWETWSFAC